MKQIIVYTQNGCRPCESLKEFLTRSGIPFEARNISVNPDYKEEVLKLNVMTTPVVVIKGGDKQQVLTGFNPETVKLIQQALGE